MDYTSRIVLIDAIYNKKTSPVTSIHSRIFTFYKRENNKHFFNINIYAPDQKGGADHDVPSPDNQIHIKIRYVSTAFGMREIMNWVKDYPGSIIITSKNTNNSFKRTYSDVLSTTREYNIRYPKYRIKFFCFGEREHIHISPSCFFFPYRLNHYSRSCITCRSFSMIVFCLVFYKNDENKSSEFENKYFESYSKLYKRWFCETDIFEPHNEYRRSPSRAVYRERSSSRAPYGRDVKSPSRAPHRRDGRSPSRSSYRRDGRSPSRSSFWRDGRSPSRSSYRRDGRSPSRTHYRESSSRPRDDRRTPYRKSPSRSRGDRSPLRSRDDRRTTCSGRSPTRNRMNPICDDSVTTTNKEILSILEKSVSVKSRKFKRRSSSSSSYSSSSGDSSTSSGSSKTIDLKNNEHIEQVQENEAPEKNPVGDVPGLPDLN